MEWDDDVVLQLRELLGDLDPGADGDPIFSNESIENLLLRVDTLDEAVAEGWKIKAALAVDLVDVTEGSTQRKMSDIHSHALAQAKFSAKEARGAGTRLGKIRRRGRT